MDEANCFPGMLKGRYFDYLKKSSLGLSRLGFESLRKFDVEELSIMTLDFVQTDKKEKLG